ncbi:MAG: hypothetical protein JSS31_02265 [Proteobacteria bacterium]|nr:hypothetical protein [Pseudomonadota bacterium]MBS0492774.1 hypothetical protein [Pseudomonadota bacterium]
MSGLLQRLAARATGNAWALQSDARLPFATVPGMPDMPETQGVEPLAPVEPLELPAFLGTPKTREGAAMPQPVPPLAATGVQEPTAQAARIQARQMAEAVASTTAPKGQPIPVALPPLQEQHPEPPRLHDKMQPEIPAMAHATVPRLAPLVPTVEAGETHGDPPPLLTAGQMRSAAAARPQQGLAPHPAAPHAPHALTPLQQAAPPAAEPAEVHIHIGRIEVTAITQPQAPRRAARETPEPLSLDAYLARRKEPS